MHDQELDLVDLDLVAGILAVEDAVPGLTSMGRSFRPRSSCPCRRRRPLPPGLFLGGVGDDDPASLGLLLFHRLDHHSVASAGSSTLLSVASAMS